MKDIIYKDLSYKLNGLFFETHNELGRFKNEKQCADKFEELLIRDGIRYEREFVLPLSFNSEHSGRNRLDFLIESEVIVDFKAKTIITKEDYFQMLRYLTSFNKKLGIIVNFRQKYLKPKRIINPEIKC
ncbi:GxxExxY protein [Candidatus Parcubacteria bacterium]|nr:GxxExxY protein [Candidatus Parcubacteria bacterium]